MNTLYLTVEEKKIFDVLPVNLKEGWDVQVESRTYEDSPERRAARLSLMRLHDPKLLAFREKAQKVSSEEELKVLIRTMDLNGVIDDDLAELFFALGPVLLGQMIVSLLRDARSEKDVQDIAPLTDIRESQLNARVP